MRRLPKPSGTSAPPSGLHVPVLRDEVVRSLASPEAVLIDATVGDGGHATALLAASRGGSRLLGVDLDKLALATARAGLAPFGDRVCLVHGSIIELETIARREGFASPTGVLFDLGLRSAQLVSGRGFSFREEAPLDLRYDASGEVHLPEPVLPALRRLARERGAFTAADLLRRLTPAELAEVLSRLGDEPHARRIADAIAAERRRSPLRTATALADLVVRSVPARDRHRRLHAATRTFLALRIAVNREFESLALGLDVALRLVRPGGRVVVLAYHSGEDRIVKHRFRDAAATGAYTVVTKHPVRPSAAERAGNPRSRSVKLRILQRS